MNDDILFSESRPVRDDTAARRSDAVRNRETLLETAVRLFQEHGVKNVTMSAVAQEAGVGKGTLYRHFNSKTELCLALLDQDQRDLQNRTLRYIGTHRETPVETLHWFLSEVAHFVDRNLEMLHVMGESGGPATLEQHVHQWWRLTIRGLLIRSGLQGDVEYMTDTLFVLLDVNTLHFQRKVRGYSITRIVNGLQALAQSLIDCSAS